MTLTRIYDVAPATCELPSFRSSLSPFHRWSSPITYAVGCEDWVPAADVAETEKFFTVSIELPGIDMKKVDVSFSDGVLTVKGEKSKESEEGECCYCSERYSGSFQRSMRIPGSVDRDKIDATYRDGVLKLTLHKTEESVSRKIEVH
ncbi:MAG: Hsp20/alpha crystallin family protein [Thermodesulfobacteriota bacterium]